VTASTPLRARLNTALRPRRAAQLFHGLTALAVGVGLVLQCFATAGTHHGHFSSVAGRLVNLPFFFTVDSNILVVCTCALLTLNPQRDGPAFRFFRMAGLVGIALTGIVYHAVLRDLSDLTGFAKASDVLLHTVSPIATVLGWLVFGPRRRSNARIALLSALFPLVYLVVTLIRGPLTKFYPYPFLNVRAHGYAQVFVNSIVVAIVFAAVASGVTWLDRHLRALPAGTNAPR
jgi:hypothetical protein